MGLNSIQHCVKKIIKYDIKYIILLKKFPIHNYQLNLSDIKF